MDRRTTQAQRYKDDIKMQTDGRKDYIKYNIWKMKRKRKRNTLLMEKILTAYTVKSV